MEQLSTGVATDSRFISKQVIDLSSKSTSHASLRSVDSVGGNGSSVTIHGDSLWSVDAQPSICARVDGEVGGVWPTPQRGHWFPSASDVTSFRRKITSLCPKDASLVSETFFTFLPPTQSILILILTRSI